MRKGEVIGIAILLAVALTVMLLYSKLPDQMIINWDSEGRAIGNTMLKINFIRLFLLGAILVFLLFLGLSRIGKLRPETKEAQFYYSGGLSVSAVVYSAIYLSVVLWNLEIKHSVLQVVAGGFGVILFFVGRVISKAKSHWFVSFRTPWTKRSKDIFDEANCFLGKLLCIIGTCGVVASFVTFYAIFAINLAMLAILYVFIYSYWKAKKVN